MSLFSLTHRLCCAALMALSGGAVAQTMTLWGGPLSRFLPPMSVTICAALAGAGVAGLLLADTFGHGGRRGALFSSVAWPLATVLGAAVGASLLAIDQVGAPIALAANALSEGAPLGIIAVADGIGHSPVVATVWLLGGVAMHFGARTERRAPI